MANPRPKPPPKGSSPWHYDMFRPRTNKSKDQPDPNSKGSQDARDALQYEKLPKKPPGRT